MRVLPMLQFRSISLHLRAEGLAAFDVRATTQIRSPVAGGVRAHAVHRSAQISKKSARKRAVKQEEAAPAPQPPPPPPPPPTLEQMPASAPQVFFRNGQL